jgi:hypothetical protein
VIASVKQYLGYLQAYKTVGRVETTKGEKKKM